MFAFKSRSSINYELSAVSWVSHFLHHKNKQLYNLVNKRRWSSKLMHFMQQRRLLEAGVGRQLRYTVCFTVSSCPQVRWSEERCFAGRWLSDLWFTFPKRSVSLLTFSVDVLVETSILTVLQSCEGSEI